MQKKLSVMWTVVIFLAGRSFAALPDIEPSLQQFLVPYGNKVGVCFMDTKSSFEVGVNAEKQFPTASVGKVPVMVTAFHLAETGKLMLEARLPLKEEDKLPGSGVLQWMRPGRTSYSIRNLIRMMIVLSDNTATKMVIGQVGLEEVNQYLKILGLKNTQIVDNTMLNEFPNPNINLSTPQDMAKLLMMIKNDPAIAPNYKSEMLAYMRNQRYRWGIWKGVPPGVIVADKTGNVDKVLNDVGLVYSPAGNYILSVFTCGFEKQRDAKKVINRISEIVYNAYVPTCYAKEIKPVKKAKIKKTKRTYVRKKIKRRSLNRKNRVFNNPTRSFHFHHIAYFTV
jgi:beta-lactamase class A